MSAGVAAAASLDVVYLRPGFPVVEGPSCESLRPVKDSRRETHTMALDQSAVLELLEALKAADVVVCGARRSRRWCIWRL
jgi:hypothetical protein